MDGENAIAERFGIPMDELSVVDEVALDVSASASGRVSATAALLTTIAAAGGPAGVAQAIAAPALASVGVSARFYPRDGLLEFADATGESLAVQLSASDGATAPLPGRRDVQYVWIGPDGRAFLTTSRGDVLLVERTRSRLRLGSIAAAVPQLSGAESRLPVTVLHAWAEQCIDADIRASVLAAPDLEDDWEMLVTVARLAPYVTEARAWIQSAPGARQRSIRRLVAQAEAMLEFEEEQLRSAGRLKASDLHVVRNSLQRRRDDIVRIVRLTAWGDDAS